jgi:hypothetical protein
MKDYEKMTILRKKQDAYMKQVQEELFLDNSLCVDEIYRFFHLSQFGESLEIYIFYKSNVLLQRNLENGITEKIKTLILEKLNQLGYFSEFSSNVLFEFDSDENVKKNYKGNYFLRLR